MTMPSWLKKRFLLIKNELKGFVSHAKTDDTGKCAIRKINNDLNGRRRSKDDINAYRDYSKLCDKVLLAQNDLVARRCAEQKFVNNVVTAKQNNCDVDAAVEGPSEGLRCDESESSEGVILGGKSND